MTRHCRHCGARLKVVRRSYAPGKPDVECPNGPHEAGDGALRV